MKRREEAEAGSERLRGWGARKKGGMGFGEVIRFSGDIGITSHWRVKPGRF
jgi:hypothetical protein